MQDFGRNHLIGSFIVAVGTFPASIPVLGVFLGPVAGFAASLIGGGVVAHRLGGDQVAGAVAGAMAGIVGGVLGASGVFALRFAIIAGLSGDPGAVSGLDAMWMVLVFGLVFITVTVTLGGALGGGIVGYVQDS